MRKYKLILLVVMLFCSFSYAEHDPTGSRFDKRIKALNYNALDVTKIRALYGYITTIKFDKDEKIIYKTTGFESGWEHEQQNNYLMITPILIKIDEDSENENTVDANDANDAPNDNWNTNLTVITNKREYIFQLVVSKPHEEKDATFLVKFHYPEDVAMLKQSERVALRQEQFRKYNETLIKEEFSKLTIPVNWDYYKSVNKGSEDISPDFAYDDGNLTFLGFRSDKKIPSVYVVNDKNEELINVNMRKDVLDNYRTLVIHGLGANFILRSGNKVVGIMNKKYGENPAPFKNSSSKKVLRKLKS